MTLLLSCLYTNSIPWKEIEISTGGRIENPRGWENSLSKSAGSAAMREKERKWEKRTPYRGHKTYIKYTIVARRRDRGLRNKLWNEFGKKREHAEVYGENTIFQLKISKLLSIASKY